MSVTAAAGYVIVDQLHQGPLGSAASSPTTPTSVLPKAVSATGDGLSAQDGWTADRPLDVDDASQPAISNLDPALLSAVRAAATDAAADGITVVVNSGWRSARYQQTLLNEAVQRYGSLGEALRWVATPTNSHHVSGNAVDLGPSAAAYWFDRHGFTYGLCRAYSNEIWHYELLTTPGGTCPALKADAGQ